MKILLINPPNRFWLWTPLGIAYVASVLKEEGHFVTILDLAVEPETNLVNSIYTLEPDIVGVTCTSQTFQNALIVARTVKRTSQKTIVVFGGAHPSSAPDDVLKHQNVDVVVKGEGELTMLDICNTKNPYGIFENKPMNIHNIPYPARELLPMQKYQYPCSILTSRGCPYQCCFCLHSVSGFRWRARKPVDVVNEMELLVKTYNLHDIHIVDDNFSLDIDRAKTIMRTIIKRKLGVNLWFFNGLRADRVDAELLTLMKKAGTQLISFGLESTNDTVLKNICKNLTLEQVENAINLTHNAGIQVRLSLMVGNIGDTFKTVMDTIDWVRKNPYIDSAEFSICTVYLGTPLYDWVRKNGRILTNMENPPTYFMDEEATPSFDTPDFPAEERVKALRKAQKTMQRKFAFKNKSWRHFRIQKIPNYASTIKSLLSKNPTKPKFRVTK